MKNPFDLALYGLLLDSLRPGTIIEVGSAEGGSGLWFAAQVRARGLSAHVYSYDIEIPNPPVKDPGVTFSYGDIHQLADTNLPGLLATCPRPLLVIEDGPHTEAGSLAALEFFESFLEPGDYIVIEDGNLKDLGYRSFRNGPNKAVDRFLKSRGQLFEIDRNLCDFFGPNVTANVNGYLKRVRGTSS